MSNIQINQIRITGSQIWAKINNIDQCLDLFSLSQLLQHITEKNIAVVSSEHNTKNDYNSFENNFFMTLNTLLSNTNYPFNVMSIKDNKLNHPFWLVNSINKEKIDHNHIQINVTLKNLMGEKLIDN